LSGVVAQQAARPADAIRYLQKAIDHVSSDAATYTLIAKLLTEQGASPSEIELLFDNLLHHSRSAEAHGAKASWLISQKRTHEAVVELWAGLQLAPNDNRLNGLLASAVHSPEQQSQLTTHLQKQIRQHPSQSRLRLFCAHTEWESGRQDDAVATLKSGIARTPQAFELLEVLIDYLVSRGDAQQAEAAFKRSPRTAIEHARWHFLKGRVLMSSGQWLLASQSLDQASGFAGSNEQLRHCSRMRMAVCRRQLGERDGALATYRSMLHDNPTSRDSRLGMAAAWLKTGRIDLAIAEYRQLMEVDGVPDLMTSLLIRETLQQPATRRNWRELDELLQDEEPIISDNVQRILLKADLLFAKGHPALALRTLDFAVSKHPDNVPFWSARRRVLTDKQGKLNQRMEVTLANRPGNSEAHVAILRMRSYQDGVQSAVSWIRAIVAGSISPQVPATTAPSPCNTSG
jgi:tetratricopeptide (TPR) repeat protein